jgi:hypothetical protein
MTIRKRRRRILGGGALLIATALTLAACGGSTTTTSSSTSAASAATGTATSNNTGFAARRAAITACLSKAGITLPTRPAAAPTGSAPATGGLFGGAGGGARLGLSDAKVTAALKNCGITFTPRPTAATRTRTPTFQHAVNSYVACMKTNGYTLPAPNFSGTGPVFTASQVNRNDPKFIAANTKCQPLLGSTASSSTTNAG